MSDWFPFGSSACLRYEFLNRVPLLPHEALLCKEAMIIYQSDKQFHEDSDHEQRKCVKVSFVGLMKFQHQVMASLKQRGAKTTTLNFSSLLCGICKHSCYVSYTICNCCPEPTCLNHGNNPLMVNKRDLTAAMTCEKTVILISLFQQENFLIGVLVRMVG